MFWEQDAVRHRGCLEGHDRVVKWSWVFYLTIKGKVLLGPETLRRGGENPY